MVTLLLSAIIPLGLSAQSQNDNDVVAAINSQLIPLKTLSPGDDYSDIKSLKSDLKNKTVIGLGESGHGVHEFFTFKLRLLEYLVKEMGIKILLTETDMAGTKIMNDYVTSGKGDVYKGMTGMGNSVWTTQEFIDMAEWVKDYNTGKPDKDKVRIYGFDNMINHNSIPLLTDYLAQTKQLTPQLQQGLTALGKNPGSLIDDDKAAIKNTFALLKTVQFTQPNENEARFYKHVADLLEQYYEFALPIGAPYPNQKNDIREKNMAINAEWLYNYTNKSKMIIWAHDEHLTKTINSLGIKRMGVFLNDTFKNNYYVLACCFNSGKLRSLDSKNGGSSAFDVPEITTANNSDALLAQCNTPNFLLNFKTASANPVIKAYLNQTVTSYFVGSNYAAKAGTDQMFVQHKWAEGFDAIVYIRKITAAAAIKPH